MSAWLEDLQQIFVECDVPDKRFCLELLHEAILQRNRLLAGLNALAAENEELRRNYLTLVERFDALTEKNAYLRYQLNEKE